MREILQETAQTKYDVPPLQQRSERIIKLPQNPHRRVKNACEANLSHSTIRSRHGFSHWVGGQILLRTDRIDGNVPTHCSEPDPIGKPLTVLMQSLLANNSRGGVE
jgi:hypothetical protein